MQWSRFSKPQIHDKTLSHNKHPERDRTRGQHNRSGEAPSHQEDRHRATRENEPITLEKINQVIKHIKILQIQHTDKVDVSVAMQRQFPQIQIMLRKSQRSSAGNCFPIREGFGVPMTREIDISDTEIDDQPAVPDEATETTWVQEAIRSGTKGIYSKKVTTELDRLARTYRTMFDVMRDDGSTFMWELSSHGSQLTKVSTYGGHRTWTPSSCQEIHQNWTATTRPLETDFTF